MKEFCLFPDAARYAVRYVCHRARTHVDIWLLQRQGLSTVTAMTTTCLASSGIRRSHSFSLWVTYGSTQVYTPTIRGHPKEKTDERILFVRILRCGGSYFVQRRDIGLAFNHTPHPFTTRAAACLVLMSSIALVAGECSWFTDVPGQGTLYNFLQCHGPAT